MTLVDLTPKLVEQAKKKAEELAINGKFKDFLVADARELNMVASDQFNASLMLGPMYHLQDEGDRVKAIKELNRVTKKGGIIFVAFMPRIRHIFTSLLSPEKWKPNESMDAINFENRLLQSFRRRTIYRCILF